MNTELSQANIWEEIKGRQLMMLCQLYSHTAQNGKIQEKTHKYESPLSFIHTLL